MYKTVRHGENSLQYTILPQTEEVLNNSGLKGKGRDYSPSIHVRRSRRKSTLKYVLMVIFGTVVALALASVPLYVMNGAIFARRMQFDHHDTTTPALTPGGREILRSRKKELKMSAETTMKPQLDIITTTTTPSTTTTPVPITVTSEKITNPSWTMPALRSWKAASSTSLPQLPTEDIERIPLIGTPSGSVRLLDHYMSMRPWDKDIIIRPTVTSEPITIRDVFNYYSIHSTEKIVTDSPKVFEDVLITTKATIENIATTEAIANDLSKFNDLKDTLLSVDTDEEAKETLEEDEVFSLPPLKPDIAVDSDSDEVTVSKTTNGWYGQKWPFVDSSTYFQWPVNSPNDSIVLPLLTGALSSITLVLILAFAIKLRKRTSHPCDTGKLSTESQTDDNTNLLTAENPEEVEE
ncbi:uncharacterized protein LOC125051844 [Pieris napi]|uniref:uncharacterized protein LOC125051844 n=1 Tax=Pieris napi TaxID=78633 RepID=UPI001FB9E1B5|nr:uncharacterized protein LOC125051844 [Pieris napi]